MAKIGIKNIRVAKKGRVDDSFFDQLGESKKLNTLSRFTSLDFVQNSAVLNDESKSDEQGTYHVISLDFITRAHLESWQDFLASFAEIPITIIVTAIDGTNYIIGTNRAPAYISIKDSYDKLSVREIVTSCEYKSKNGLMKVTFTSDSIQEPQITVNQQVVMVPWQGGSGTIFVDSNTEWEVVNVDLN